MAKLSTILKSCERLGVSSLNGKRVEREGNSATKELHKFCNHSSGFCDFSILAATTMTIKLP